jgi:hypothetical protein
MTEEPRYPGLTVEDIDVNFGKGQRDESLFHTAYSLIRGGMNPENVEIVLTQLASSCSPPFPKSEAIIKVKSAVERAYKQDRNLSQEIKEWVSVTSGVFSVTDIYNALHCVTPEDKGSARQALRRLKEGRLIEPYGLRADTYRRIDPDYTEMNYRLSSVQPLDIDWPLNLHKYFYVYAKNLIVFAGTKCSGKTTMMFEIIERNQAKWNIHYFTNELSDEELAVRLGKNKAIAIGDWKFKAYERSENYSDVIFPDDFNIVDYLEQNEDFSQMGTKLSDIHAKLNKGIAIVCIQLKHGEQWGTGGRFSNQRARVYINLESLAKDFGRATIKVAKNPRDGFNPVGLSTEYKIVDGYRVLPQGEWEYNEEY